MTHNTNSHRFRNIALAVVAATMPVLLAGACSTKYTSERDGKALGQALCDLKDAENADERQSALDDIDSELENLENEYAFYTSEDREEFQSNLKSFESNVEAKDLSALQEDLASLDSSAKDVASNAGEVTQAAWDGLRQGLSNCIG
jgi:hypothetical protein